MKSERQKTNSLDFENQNIEKLKPKDCQNQTVPSHS